MAQELAENQRSAYYCQRNVTFKFIQLNALDYQVWENVRGLYRYHPTSKIIVELKEMLQVTS